MLETHLRQVAAVLLETAIRIAPPDARDWGRAMRGELSYVEGTWAPLMWALGGASVLAKRAFASLLIPAPPRAIVFRFNRDRKFPRSVPASNTTLHGHTERFVNQGV